MQNKPSKPETDTKTETTNPTPSGRRTPWIWIVSALVAVIMVMAFALGYMFAVNRTARTSQTNDQQTTQQQPTADMKQLAKAMNSVDDKPTATDSKGGILISRNGYGKSIKNVPTIGLYEEPLCPYCAQLNRRIDPTIVKLVKAGQINLDLHFVNFLNQASSDNYSNRVASGAIVIAEQDKDPMHLLEFLKNVYAEGFMPQEGPQYKPVSDEQLRQQAVNAGVDPQVAAKAFDGKAVYTSWLDAATAYTTNRVDIQAKQNGRAIGFSTPTLTINGVFWDKAQTMSQDPAVADQLLKAVGLAHDDLGVTGKTPGIGAKGKPRQ